MVVEVGLVDPRVDALQRVDDRRVGVRVLVVALDDHAAAGRQVGLAEALRGDRAADELDRDRVAGARGGAHVAGDERVDVAGDEDDVLDLLVADVGQQLLALLRVALPAVEAEVGAAEDLASA